MEKKGKRRIVGGGEGVVFIGGEKMSKVGKCGKELEK